MIKKTDNADLSAHEEEAIPFDDAMRTILKAKPMPRKAHKPKAKKRRPKKD